MPGLWDRILGRQIKPKEEQVARVVASSYVSRGIVPDPAFSTMVDYYRRDPTVRAAIDFFAELSVGAGFFIRTSTAGKPDNPSSRASTVLEDFCEQVNLDNWVLTASKHAFGFGNLFGELVFEEGKYNEVECIAPVYGRLQRYGKFKVPRPGADIVDLKTLPLSSLSKIYTDEFGKVIAYQQKLGNDTNLLSPEVVVHYPWNRIDADLLGLGLIHTLALPGVAFTRKKADGTSEEVQRASYLETKDEMLNDLRGFFKKYLGRYAIMWEGENLETVRANMKAISEADENQDIGISSGIPEDANRQPAKVSITPMTLDARGRVDMIFDYFSKEMTLGLQTPTTQLFTSPGFTYASSKEGIGVSDRKISAFQRDLKRLIEKRIFVPVLNQNGLKNVSARLIWGAQRTPEFTVNDYIELGKLGPDYIRPEEIRKNLTKIGIELWEPTAEELAAKAKANADAQVALAAAKAALPTNAPADGGEPPKDGQLPPKPGQKVIKPATGGK